MALAAAAAVWHLSEWKAPVIGTSPLLDEPASDVTTDAVSTTGAVVDSDSGSNDPDGVAEEAPGESGAGATPDSQSRESLSESSPLSTQGIGPVLAGMSVPEAEKAAGVDLKAEGEAATPGCQGYAPEGLSNVSFLVRNGEVAVTNVSSPEIKTLSGVGIGDTESSVLDVYGDQISKEPAELNPDYNVLTYAPDDPGDETRLVFTTDGVRVTFMKAGRLPEVEYVEGCL